MSKNAIKRVLMAKIESVYGTDPTPDATCGILCSNLSLAPMAGSIADRQKAHATFGADDDAHVGTYQTLSFDVGLAGSGAAGTAPLYGPLLRACGLSETITASTKVEYSPIDSSQESVTLYFNWDGLLHKLTGARGTVSFKWPGAGLPMMSFAISGLFAPATDTTAVNVETALASFLKEIEVNKANATTFTFHSFAAELETLQVDLGNTVLFRDRPNADYIALTDRKAAGSIAFAAPAVSGLDVIGRAKAGTLGAIALVHGTTAGNIIQLDAAKAQLRQPTYQNTNNILHVSSQLGLVRTSGNDELKLTVK